MPLLTVLNLSAFTFIKDRTIELRRGVQNGFKNMICDFCNTTPSTVIKWTIKAYLCSHLFGQFGPLDSEIYLFKPQN